MSDGPAGTQTGTVTVNLGVDHSQTQISFIRNEGSHLRVMFVGVPGPVNMALGILGALRIGFSLARGRWRKSRWRDGD